MSDSLNNKELVAVGHQFAKAISSDTPIMDIAKIVSRLAERLDCTTAALREMTKQRDADHADVLAWEKTMFKACGEDGLKSVAEKFAELQARCAALAAENAGLKESRKNLAEFIHEELNADYPLNMSIETPATDAFLAEVRASAVDEVCLKISNSIPNCYQDEQVGLDAAATICGDFTAQLRKGSATKDGQSFLSDEDCHAFVKAFTKGAAQ